MVAVNPNGGEVIQGRNIAGNEYSFYNNLRYNRDAYASAAPEEKTLYDLLSARVATYGTESLNRNYMGPAGVVGGGVQPVLPYGGPNNPAVFNTFAEAQQAHIGHTLKQVKPGLYQDYSLENGYVFILQTSGSRTRNEIYTPPTTSTNPIIPDTKSHFKPWGAPKYKKPTKEVMKKVAQDYDLLFNALEYTKTYEQEAQRLTMDLIEAGDDILTNYTYESIDFLPDVDIEVKTSNGEYKNAVDVFQQTDQSQYLETVVDESEASEDIQLANKLISYIEERISTNTQFNTLLDYYGSINNNKFTGAVPTENKVDFYIELPEEFDDLDVEIRFDRI
jgi:hypothetical protein